MGANALAVSIPQAVSTVATWKLLTLCILEHLRVSIPQAVSTVATALIRETYS